jgi:hypothetical protein
MQDGVVPGHSRRCTDGLAVPRPWHRSTRRIELAEMRDPEPAKFALNADPSPAFVLPAESDDAHRRAGHVQDLAVRSVNWCPSARFRRSSMTLLLGASAQFQSGMLGPPTPGAPPLRNSGFTRRPPTQLNGAIGCSTLCSSAGYALGAVGRICLSHWNLQ